MGFMPIYIDRMSCLVRQARSLTLGLQLRDMYLLSALGSENGSNEPRNASSNGYLENTTGWGDIKDRQGVCQSHGVSFSTYQECISAILPLFDYYHGRLSPWEAGDKVLLVCKDAQNTAYIVCFIRDHR